MKKNAKVPVFLDGRGCPFRCAFCNQKSVTNGKKNWTIEELDRLFESYERNSRELEICFYGGSFNFIEENYREKLLSWAYNKIREGRAKGIRVSVRPDNLGEDFLKELIDKGTKVLELGVQILDDEVLSINTRGHSSKDSLSAIERGKRLGIYVSSHIMLGLFGSTWEMERKTALELWKAGTDGVRIHPTLVLKGSLYEKWYREGIYNPISLNEAVERASELFSFFHGRGVEVLRIGLHPDPVLKRSVVAGPFHPSIGDMVKSRVFGKLILNASKFGKTRYIVINPRDRNYLKGYKKENEALFRNLFEGGFLVEENRDLPRFSLSTEKVSLSCITLSHFA